MTAETCEKTAETGLFDAAWITGRDPAAPRFKKTFYLSAVPESARVAVCGLGYFALYLNGKKVGADYFVPVQSDYSEVTYENLSYPFSGETKKRAFYLVYPIESCLHPGENRIELQLAPGWYAQNVRLLEGRFDYGPLRAALCMVIGDTVIKTDGSWEELVSPYRAATLFRGEIYDAGREQTVLGNALSAPRPKTRLLRQRAPADRIREIIKPAELRPGLFDAGKIVTGFARINCRGTRGGSVRLRYAECVTPETTLDFSSTVGYGASDREQIQEDVFILSGDGDETYCPAFTWHGFRYFEAVCENASLLSAEVLYVAADMKQTGDFVCSDERLNRLFALFGNSLISSVHGAVPMDCPHRERLGYTGDGQNASDGLMYFYDADALYRKWIGDILDAQNPETGFVPHTAPFLGGGGGPLWGSAVVFVPWNHYRHYRDVSVLRDAYPAMCGFVSYLLGCRDAHGLVAHEETGSWCLGDWCLPSDGLWNTPHKALSIPEALVNTCALVRCMRICDKVGALLGLAPRYEREIERAADAVNKAYLNDNGYYAAGIQGCDAFPLDAGIVPAEKRDAVLRHLIRHEEEKGSRIDTGMFGTAALVRVLHRAGRDDLVFRLLRQREYPGYGYMLENGATAVWETWEGSGSHNHTALTGCSEWFFTGLMGITPDESEGLAKIKIAPYYAPELTFAACSCSLPSGSLSVCWKRESGDKINVTISLPENADAVFVMPGGKEMPLFCGENTFSVDAAGGKEPFGGISGSKIKKTGRENYESI